MSDDDESDTTKSVQDKSGETQKNEIAPYLCCDRNGNFARCCRDFVTVPSWFWSSNDTSKRKNSSPVPSKNIFSSLMANSNESSSNTPLTPVWGELSAGNESSSSDEADDKDDAINYSPEQKIGVETTQLLDSISETDSKFDQSSSSSMESSSLTVGALPKNSRQIIRERMETHASSLVGDLRVGIGGAGVLRRWKKRLVKVTNGGLLLEVFENKKKNNSENPKSLEKIPIKFIQEIRADTTTPGGFSVVLKEGTNKLKSLDFRTVNVGIQKFS
eukprot:GHVL01033485.1.p1 GENE.GHVL01033485.1~~GHVL01033485.1.p1  ORF type:complete len:274 (+),score=52.99 GHVL01033485.1:42-863(+)